MPVNVGRGKQYRTVQERLEAAHGEKAQPVGITSVLTEPMALVGPVTTGVIVIRATITFEDGRQFTGISEAQFDATSGADKTNPVEVAETSAVGRALAFAGYYGSEDGIAGAEEMQRASQRSRQAAPNAPRHDPADELRQNGAVVRESPPQRTVREVPPPKPGKDGSQREWFAYLAYCSRLVNLYVPTIGPDTPDAELADFNRTMTAALNEHNQRMQKAARPKE